MIATYQFRQFQVNYNYIAIFFSTYSDLVYRYTCQNFLSVGHELQHKGMEKLYVLCLYTEFFYIQCLHSCLLLKLMLDLSIDYRTEQNRIFI